MKIVTLEEHYRYQHPGDPEDQLGLARSAPEYAGILAKLDKIAEERVADMDGAGITTQVLSHVAPGTATLERSQRANDWVRERMDRYPGRFAAFATLPMSDPAAAPKELERAIRELGFKGALISGTSEGRFMDDPCFRPILERAEALGVPLYLHPGPPPEAIMDIYFSGLDPAIARILSLAGWGWHAEQGLHLFRLICAGTFDRFPRLQVIIGHMGEMVPFILARSDAVLSRFRKGLQKPVSDYVHDNVWMTSSGMFTTPPFLLMLQVIGIDRMMFSIDYPYSSNRQGRDFLDKLPLAPADLEKFAHGNAERLLGL